MIPGHVVSALRSAMKLAKTMVPSEGDGAKFGVLELQNSTPTSLKGGEKLVIVDNKKWIFKPE